MFVDFMLKIFTELLVLALFGGVYTVFSINNNVILKQG